MKEGLKTIDHRMNGLIQWLWGKMDWYGKTYVSAPLAVSEQYLLFADGSRNGASFCTWMAYLAAKVDPESWCTTTSTLVVSTRGCLLIGDWKDDEHSGGTKEEKVDLAKRAVVAFHNRPGVETHDKLFGKLDTPQWVIAMSCDGNTVYLDWMVEGLSEEDRLKCRREVLRVLKLVDNGTFLRTRYKEHIDEDEQRLGMIT